MKITFKEFRSFLLSEGCSEVEVCRLYGAVRSMDAESRKWVVRWFCTNEMPEEEIEGVTARYLVDKCGYNPLNAFVILDWLKSDPQAAKYFLLKIPVTISPSESIGEEVVNHLRREGHDVTEPLVDINLDKSDIQE